jgi:hypothetical protein
MENYLYKTLFFADSYQPALEFVESIDDVVFELAKRGFFGHILKDAANQSHEFSYKKGSQNKKYKLWINRFVRLMYFFNAGVMITLLCVIMTKQNQGAYRCKSFSVQFGDNTWDESWIELENGGLEQRLLVYSHFNGVYIGEILYFLSTVCSHHSSMSSTHINRKRNA